MAAEFKLPELGENVESGTVVNILVAEGDEIEKDQSVIELETDKALVEVPSDVAGKISKILVKEGDEIKVGQKILELDGSAEESGDKAPKESSEQQNGKAEAGDSSEKKEEKEKQKPKKDAPKKETQKKETQKKEAQKKPKGESKTVDVKLPELGENVETGTVVELLVAEGDEIEKDQNLIELETDKASFELPSEVAGTIKEIKVKAGDEVKVGQTIVVVSTSAESPAAGEAEAEEPEEEPDTDGKSETTEETAERDQPEQKRQPADSARPEAPAPKAEPGKIAPAAPSVRRFAREIGVDINEVPGSGPSGRISIDDVKAHSKQRHQQRAAAPATAGLGIEAEPLPDFSKWGKIEREKMSKVREKTATHLSYAWATIPHVTQFDKADMTELEKLRKQYGKRAEEAGGKLTVTAILLKIVQAAMKVYPQFNASVDMANKEVIYKKYYNIGVAVDTERGLLVPVIRNVDQKNIIDLAVELSEVAEKARNKKLSLDDMQGGNFSISNLGGIGGTAFTPIVNAPEVAILGISRSTMEPVYHDGEFEPRFMIPLALSYDHRLIDGADAARFLRWVAQAIEQPFMIVLEG